MGADPDVLIFLGDDISEDYILSLGLNARRAYICGGSLIAAPEGAFEVISSDSFTEFGIAFNFTDGGTLTAVTGGVKSGICTGELVPEGCDLLIGDVGFDLYEQAKTAYAVNFSAGSGDWCVYTGGDKNFVARTTLSLCLVF